MTFSHSWVGSLIFQLLLNIRLMFQLTWLLLRVSWKPYLVSPSRTPTINHGSADQPLISFQQTIDKGDSKVKGQLKLWPSVDMVPPDQENISSPLVASFFRNSLYFINSDFSWHFRDLWEAERPLWIVTDAPPVVAYYCATKRFPGLYGTAAIYGVFQVFLSGLWLWISPLADGCRISELFPGVIYLSIALFVGHRSSHHGDQRGVPLRLRLLPLHGHDHTARPGPSAQQYHRPQVRK